MERLYFLPQYLANLAQPIWEKESRILGYIRPCTDDIVCATVS